MAPAATGTRPPSACLTVDGWTANHLTKSLRVAFWFRDTIARIGSGFDMNKVDIGGGVMVLRVYRGVDLTAFSASLGHLS